MSRKAEIYCLSDALLFYQTALIRSSFKVPHIPNDKPAHNSTYSDVLSSAPSLLKEEVKPIQRLLVFVSIILHFPALGLHADALMLCTCITVTMLVI